MCLCPPFSGERFSPIVPPFAAVKDVCHPPLLGFFLVGVEIEVEMSRALTVCASVTLPLSTALHLPSVPSFELSEETGVINRMLKVGFGKIDRFQVR